jgi:hypothetical protein
MQPPRVNSVFAGSGNWCRGFGVCLQARLLGNVGFPLSERNRNGFWIFKYREKILSQLNFTFCVLLQLWNLEKFWRVASVTTSCLWWRHTSFTRNGLCSVKRKRSTNDVIWGFIRHLLGGNEENHQGFWGWLLLLQVCEPGTFRVRSRSDLKCTLKLIVFHSDTVCGLPAEGLITAL